MPGWELVGKEERDAVLEVFDKGGVLYRYGLNDRRQNIFRVDEFERRIAAKVGAKHALMVCNGTAALKLCLVAAGVKAGDEVVTQSFTFIATVEAILELGAVPVIAEIDGSLNMDPTDLARRITKKTRAVVPVHMGGVPARMKEISAVAAASGLPVVEDSAQALGATYGGRWLGTLGQCGIYSLDIGKVITTGEGGVVVTDDTDVYLRAREYSDHGHEQNPKFPRGEDTRTGWGFNYKATELQGAVALAQLPKLDGILKAQRENKRRIRAGIADIPGLAFREIPDPAGDAGDTLIFFLETRERASAFAKKLAARGFGTKNLPDAIDWHYAGTWTHIFSAYPEFKGQDLEAVWPKSTGWLRRAVALPILVNMTDERIAQTVEAVRAVAGEV